MRAKKNWWFSVVLAELVVIIILIPGNCRRNTGHNKPSDVGCRKKGKATQTLLPDNDTNQPTCRADRDCLVPSTYCEEGVCVSDFVDEEEEISDGGGQDEGALSCTTENDCGCGYLCVDNSCYKTDLYCCTDRDCKEKEFCSTDTNSPNGLCIKNECDTDEQCGKCGTECHDHLCVQLHCCVDADCKTGEFCSTDDGGANGYCLTSECTTNADCGQCGLICSNHRCRNDYGCDSNRPCCGDDICHEGRCWNHSYIENGSCLRKKDCPDGLTCSDYHVCFPETCAKNADCGYEAVCRKGSCETGCDNDKDCELHPGATCDRGQCIELEEIDEED